MGTVIQIVDHRPEWREMFAAHAAEVSRALGARALRIEHIGSTSVPGLAAKPIIDILLVVADSSDEDSYLPQLEAAGYSLHIREPEFHGHRLLRTPDADVHLHVFPEGSAEVERYLLFRDRLRVNSADRVRYEALKRELATRTWADMDEYATAKTAIVEEIIAAAQLPAPLAR